VGIFGLPRSFISSSSFFFVSESDVVFPMSGLLREERQRQRVVDTVRGLKMKCFSRIS
jgi:hypothetical protein